MNSAEKNNEITKEKEDDKDINFINKKRERDFELSNIYFNNFNLNKKAKKDNNLFEYNTITNNIFENNSKYSEVISTENTSINNEELINQTSYQTSPSYHSESYNITQNLVNINNPNSNINNTNSVRSKNYDTQYLKMLEQDEFFPDDMLLSIFQTKTYINPNSNINNSNIKIDMCNIDNYDKKETSNNLINDFNVNQHNNYNNFNLTDINLPTNLNNDDTKKIIDIDNNLITNTKSINIPNNLRKNNNDSLNDNKFFTKAIKRIYKSCLTKGIVLTPEEKTFFKNHKNSTRKFKINVNDEDLFIHFTYKKKEMRNPLEVLTIKKSEEKYKECMICLETFKPLDSMKLINQCNHIFHKTNCIHYHQSHHE